jgi:hypothetical protein
MIDPMPILSGIGSSTSGKPKACRTMTASTSIAPMLKLAGARGARRN